MSKRVRNRLLVTLGVILGSVFLFAGFPPSLEGVKQRIRLGLDLRGGTHLVMGVVTDDAIRAETDLAIDRLREILQQENILFRQAARVTDSRFQFAGVDPTRDADVRRLASQQLPEWRLVSTSGDAPNTYVFGLDAASEALFREQAVSQAIQTIRNRIDQLGVTEPVIQEYGGPGQYQVLVQLPGVDDPARVKSIMQSTALLELKLVEAGPFPSQQTAVQAYGGAVPPNVELLPSAEADLTTGGEAWYAVQRIASITGRDLKSAAPDRDENNRPAVRFNLTADGSERFGRVTESNIGRQLAIVLDSRIQSAPVINGPITNTGIITGGPTGFSLQEAQDLSLVLRSGALPASLIYEDERVVGPSLGADSIRQGITAGVVTLIFILLFMIFYYRLAGINVTIALTINILILFAALAYFEAVLTLPGIAGVILTIGMGIDSNILIFERIREELKAGKTPVSSVLTGFNRVFITIVDMYLTSMIAALCLFLFGTGPVRGFAVTLAIGLAANAFTSVFVSRTMFEWLLGRQERATTLSI